MGYKNKKNRGTGTEFALNPTFCKSRSQTYELLKTLIPTSIKPNE